MKKLLIAGSNTVHIKTYLNLIEGYFDEICFLTHFSNEAPPENCRTYYLDFSLRNPLKVFFNIRKIKKHLKTFRPDVIHIHQANSYAFLTLKANACLSIPSIVTAWGSDVLLSPKKGLLYREMFAYILKNADLYTADARFIGHAMQAFVKKNIDITVANFGVSVDIGEKSHKEKIIYSNRLHNPLYRIDKIIKSFSTFHKNFPDWRLIIAATGSETDTLKKLVRDLEMDAYIEFAGWIKKEENINFYKKSTYFVSVPESDGTSVSLLEAMAYGCIPIVSDLPANKEWVEDKENGFIVKDIESNFLDNIFDIDTIIASEKNKQIVKERALKSTNRALFTGCYDRLLSKTC